jgi:hypothetical protein
MQNYNRFMPHRRNLLSTGRGRFTALFFAQGILSNL